MASAVASTAALPFKRRGRAAVDPAEAHRAQLDRDRDTAWVKCTLEGDGEAFRELVEHYQDRVFRISLGVLGNREEARDTAQEAFFRVYRSLHRFQFGQNFYTWLYRIVVNLSIDALRKRGQDRQVPLEDLKESVSVECPPDSNMAQQEVARRVKTILTRLPPKYKVVLVLRDIEDLGCVEIGRIVGCTHATARWRLHKARKMFKELWEQHRRRMESGPGCWNRSLESLDPVGSRMESVDS